ncbi:hypothetical protein GCM10007235_13560 [Pseudoxanthomonas indica]|nr:hypothetical protein GCM10007235_13560 [Pseudoxanthomonas indica]
MAQTVIGPSNTPVVVNSSDNYQISNGITLTASGDYVTTLRVDGIAPYTFRNFGSVISSSGGGSSAYISAVDGTFINEVGGKVWGQTYGVGFNGAPSNANVINHGDISAGASHPLAWGGSASGTFDNYATVNGGVAGTVGESPNGVTIDGTGSVTVNNHAGATIKTGMSNATYGDGVQAFTSSNITVNNEGSISAHHSAVLGSSTSKFVVNNAAGGTLTGDLKPAILLASNNVVRNAGTISSPNGGITFTGSNNTLILESTSSITGNVLGGTDGTFALGGSVAGSFSLGQLGSTAQYRDFSLFEKRDAGTWTLSGNGSQNWTIKSGTLVLDDTVVLNSTLIQVQAGGTLQIGNGGEAAVVTGAIDNQGNLVVDQTGGGQLFSAVVSGSGSFTKVSSGQFTITGDNTYTGGTTISEGELFIGAGGTSGSIVGDVVNNGRIVFYRADDVAFAGNMSGTGRLYKEASNVLTLTGTSTYSGGTQIDGGTLVVGGGGLTGSVTGDIVNNGTLIADRAGFLQFSGVISGNGGLTNRSVGTLQLTASNTFVGQVRLESGTLEATQAGNFGTLGNTLIFDGGALRWLNSFFIGRPAQLLGGGGRLDSNGLNVEWRSLTTGAGQLTKSGEGTVFLTNANTYAGNTVVLGGNLQIGMGSTTGSVLGDIDNRASLTFNRSDDAAFAGIISGVGNVTQIGPGTLTFTGQNTYTGGTTISGGSLQLGDGGVSGGLTGNVLNNGQLIVHRADNVTDAAGLISGSGGLTQRGPGTLTLTRNHSFTGLTTVASGTLRIGDGNTSGAVTGNILNNATLIHDRSDLVVYAGSLSGSGSFLKQGTGTLTLTGSNPFTGQTQVSTGSLFVDGSLGGSVQVSNSALLAGTGSLDGTVEILSGGHLAPGDSPGTLFFDTLLLNNLSQLDYELGTPDVVDASDLSSVEGDLTLDGVLNITDVGGFGDGVYRLFNYGGSLTDNGLQFGALPLGFANTDLLLQTSVLHQINLIVSQGGLEMQFWDGANETGNGAIDGGTSIWNNTSTRWTSSTGSVNAPWQGGFAVFQGAAGTVTLGDNVRLNGAQFLSNYTLEAGGFSLQGDADALPVRVDPGVTATLNAPLANASGRQVQLIKRDAGTLVLGGVNSYTGGTLIEGGTVQVSSDANLGDVAGNVQIDDGARLAATGSFASNRGLLVGGGFAGVAPAAGVTLTWNGVVQGAGGLDKQDAGTLILTGANTYSGGTRIAGTLQLGNGGTTGSVLGSISNNGSLVINRSNAVTLDGAINGTGSLTQQGSGTTTLTGANAYSGGTFLNQGVLEAGTDSRLGAASGGLTFNGGTLRTGAGFDSTRAITLNAGGGTIDDASDAHLRGVLSGVGGLTKTGAGVTTLTGANTYSGGTTISAGTLQIGDGGTTGSVQGAVSNAGSLIFNRSDASSFSGAISGTGDVSVLGGGTLTLSGANSYSGINGTQVRAGSTLVVANNGNLGAATTRVLLDNGSTLRLTSSFALTRNVVVDTAGGFGKIDTQANTITVSGVVSGDAGLEKLGAGSLLLTADNLHTGGTRISAGTLQIGNGGTTGSVLGGVINLGALNFNRSNTYTFGGQITGSGSVTQLGTGTLILNGDNSYTGATTVAAGTLQVGAGGTTGSVLGNIVNNAALVFNRSDSLTYAGVISGTGSLAQNGTGVLTLSGVNTLTGLSTVNAGRLLVSGSLAGAVQVNAGGWLGGSGSVGGAVNVADGATLAPGMSPGTLSLASLTLSPGSLLNYELGLPDIVGGGVNDLLSVAGQLTLDGTLNISDAGAFGDGVYRLFDYGGTLTNNGLIFGSLPSGFAASDLLLQTSIANQVNLVVSAGGFGLQFWDGPNTAPNNAIDGGTATWDTTASRWTNADGSVNASWQGGFAVFQGSAGSVTLGADAAFAGMQFRTDGYVIAGGGFSLAGNSAEAVLRVDPGVSATVNAIVTDGSGGAVRLVKTDAGALILGSANSYSGGTAINGGRLQVATDAALGSAGAGVAMDNGVLASTSTFGSTRALVLGSAGGGLAPSAGTVLTWSGVVSGAGGLEKLDAGRLVLSGVNTYSGGTRLSGGILSIGADTALGASTAPLQFNGGTLQLLASFNLAPTRAISLTAAGGSIDSNGQSTTLSQSLQGPGALTKLGAGTLVLTGANLFTGGTTIAAGTLQLGAGGTSGSVVGNIVNNGTLVLARSDSLGYDGIISGTGHLTQQGPGTLTLTADQTYTGGTSITGGTLQLGDSTATGSVLGDISNNGALIFARSDTFTYAGNISGSGSLTQQGPGTLIFTANHGYFGGTRIDLGATLQLGNAGSTGSVDGDVVNDGTLVFNRSDEVLFGGAISGTGQLQKQGAGELVLLNNVIQSGTTILDGTLRIGDGGIAGTLAGDIVNNANLVFERSDTYTQGSAVSGTGALEQRGTGTLILGGNNNYSGGTLISAGTLQVGDGLTGRIVGDVVDNGALVFNRNDSVSYAGVVSGTGTLDKQGSGVLTLTAAHSFTGLTTVSAGGLVIQGSLAGDVQVNDGASLGGEGDVAGAVTVEGGGQLSPGDSPGTLSVDSLLLNDTSQLDYELGAPNIVGGGVNDLIEVAGNLSLDGELNITNVGGFGNGVYRLFNYGGSLTDNGLRFAVLPSGIGAGDLLLQTSVINQINLIVSRGGLSLQFWDGADTVGDGSIDGGTSVWNTSESRWTSSDGSVNAPWQGGFAVFSGAAGTVTLGEDISLEGAQFTVDGYVIDGAGFSLRSNQSELELRPDAGVGATVNAVIADGSGGAVTLVKRGEGSLQLNGVNTHTGGTRIEAGQLQVAADAALGAAAGTVSLDGGTLATTSSFSTNRTIQLLANGGAFAPAAAVNLTLGGVISGAGALEKRGAGTLILTASNSYSGGTTVEAGTLQLGNGGTSGSLMGDVVNNGAVVVNRSNQVVMDATISGTGSLTQAGAGALQLNAVNSYSGGTFLNAGTVDVLADNRLGAASGALTFNGGILRTGDGFQSSRSLIVNATGGSLETAGVATFNGTLSGAGGLTKLGAGRTILAADNTYAGGTTISAGILQVGNGGATGSITGNVLNNASLLFNRTGAYGFAGNISGSGQVAVVGGGTLTLSGVNSYAGGTQVRAGSTLVVSSDGNLGAAAGQLLLGNGSRLRLASNFTLARDVVLAGATTYDSVDTQANTVIASGVVSGEAGLWKEGSGTLILTANNTYAGGTTVAAGTLQFGNGGATGSILGDIVNQGAVVVNRSGTLSYGGWISGSGSFTQAGPGTLILTGDHTYTGGTTISGGTLQLGDGGVDGRIAGNISNQGALVVNHSDAVNYAGVISGSGSLTQQGSGSLTLSGANSFTGLTTVAQGSLWVTGSLAGAAQVNNAALLGGTGSIAGNVTVADGGVLAPGTSPGTLSVGSLLLNPGSQLNYELGLAGVIGGGVNDLVTVAGNLQLDGALSISDLGGFGDGVYRLFDYGGSLTDNGLVFGTLPSGVSAGELLVQTSIANQINLIVTRGGFGVQFWDGPNVTSNNAIDGGSAVWNGVDTRWTNADGEVNASWQNGFAVFQGAAGTVTLGQDTTLTGAQFRTDGYVVAGNGFQLQAGSAETVMRVDPGVTATLNVGLRDGGAASRLIKTDLGTLVLNSANSHGGGTEIRDGVLRINQDAALGAAGAGVIVSGATLATGASISSGRAFVLNEEGARFAPDASTALTLNGVLSGAGGVEKIGAGTLVLNGNNSYAGGTRLVDGVLAIDGDASLGAPTGALTLAGGILRADASFALAANRSVQIEAVGAQINTQANTLRIDNAIQGAGGLTKSGSGSLLLSGNNGYLGGTQILAGTLQVGAGGSTGAILGNVLNNGQLVIARSNTVGYDGVISGSGALTQQGPGTLILSGNHTYTGGTTISAGTLQLGDGASSGSVLGNVTNHAALTFLRSDDFGFAGVISGSGAVTQAGTGTLTFTANHSYTGGTTIAQGSRLRLGDGGVAGGVVGNIVNQGQLIFNRSNEVVYAGQISGTGALTQQGPGMLTLLGTVNQSGITTIAAGSLRIGNGGSSGALTGEIDNQSQLIFQRGDTLLHAGLISGAGSVEQRGAGTLILTAQNSYSGGTLISAGTLQIGQGLQGSLGGDIDNRARLVFARDDDLRFDGVITGAGSVSQQGQGTLVLTADHSYTGLTTVAAGGLRVEGRLQGAVQVQNGSTLGGSGAIAGRVDIADGGHLAPGSSAGTLTLGELLLHTGSRLDYELGQADVVGGGINDLVQVQGNLTLDGTLDVTDLGGFGNGVYRLFNYGGTLTNNGLQLGNLPAGTTQGDAVVQTSIGSEVNLVVSRGGFALQFWDGSDVVGDGQIDGGTAVWDDSQSHWTSLDGASNVSWQSGFAVFGGSAGTVTLGSDVNISGMQFRVGGYEVVNAAGDASRITADDSETIIRVDQDIEARIDAAIVDGAAGAAKLIKSDRGRLILGGANTYSGGTQVNGGQLQIGSDGNLGTTGSAVGLDRGTLITTAGMATNRSLVLGKGHGSLAPAAGTTLDWRGAISGQGGLAMTGDGTVILGGDNHYQVGTFLARGVLQVSRDANLGNADAAIVFAGGTLRWGADFNPGTGRQIVLNSAGRFDTQGFNGTVAQAITGEGGLIKQGGGRLILTGENEYAGNTAIEAGTLQIGDGGTHGSVLGDISNQGHLVFSRSDDLTFAGTIVGTGHVTQQGPGLLTLSRNQGYSGGTTIAAGKLMLGQGSTTGSVLGDIANQGELIFNRTDTVLHEGVITGSGALLKLQNNTLVLSADHQYTGGTTISAGQLRLGNGGSTGSVRGDVLNNGELAFFRSGTLDFSGVIRGSGGVRQLGSGVVTLSGQNSYGGGTFLQGGTLSVAQDSALGAASGGVFFDGGSLRLTASFDSDRALHIQAGNGVIQTVGTRNKLSRNIDGNGSLLKLGDGVLILNYGGSHTGGTQVREGSLVVGDSAHPKAVLRNGPVGVASGASLGGYGSIIGAVTNQGFIGVGNALPALASEPDAVFTIVGNLVNAGTISMLNGVAADQLVIKQGQFQAVGGSVQVETVLNGGELDTQSDQLVVDGVTRGDAGGMTGLQVTAVGGGAGQVTNGDGIRVVDVAPGGVSEAGAFGLLNRVVAGSHEYLLFHGGLSNPRDGDWYLRSESSEPERPLPILRPEIGGFVGNRFLAERMLVHTLHQRQGEPDPTLDSDDEERGPLWANVHAAEANTQTGDGLVQLRSNSWRFQTGVDLMRRRGTGGGVLRVGPFLQYGQADTDTQAVVNPARGNARTTGYGLGVYATWLGNPETMLGAYVDGWVQYNRFDNEVEGSAGYRADYDASGWAASLEAGYAIALGKRIVLQPQLQYVRVNLDTDSLIDRSHTQIVDLTRSDWVARIGARLYGVPDKPGGFSPFVEVNWWRRAGNTAIQFNNDEVDHLVPKSLPTVDVGVQGNFGHGWNAWLRLGSDISDERYEEISGSAGVRFQW